MSDRPSTMFPDYLDEAPHASLDHGRRVIAWTIRHPGCLHRNHFAWATIEVRERTPMAGEPLSVIATRRTSDDSRREGFTSTASAAIRAEILPAVAAAGFSEMWTRYFIGLGYPGGALHSAEEAEAHARWWRLQAELIEMCQDDPEILPLLPEGMPEWISVPTYNHSMSWRREAPTARVMVGGAQVGWVLRDGTLAPIESVSAGA